MKILIVHTMHSTTIEAMLRAEGQEENYWGFLGFWNRVTDKLALYDIEVRYLISEAFMPLLETEKARQKLQNVRGATKYCLPEKHFGALWHAEPMPESDALVLQSFKMGDYSPDIIIGHDDLKKLRLLFPEAACLGIEVGAYSRPPYPGTFFLDPFSFDAREIAQAYRENHDDLMANTKDILAEIRSVIAPAFDDIPDQAMQHLASLREAHKHILLLAIQYPSPRYSPYTNHDDLLDLCEDILQYCPSDTALLLCPRAHNFQDLKIAEADWEALRRRYPNVSLFPGDMTWPYYTQMLVPHVDGVVAVTSTVGLQAPLWGKHWFTSPQSFYHGIAPGYDQITNCINDKPSPLARDYVNWMTQYFWIPNEVLSEVQVLVDMLNIIHDNKKEPRGAYLKALKDMFEKTPMYRDKIMACFKKVQEAKSKNKVIEIISL